MRPRKILPLSVFLTTEATPRLAQCPPLAFSRCLKIDKGVPDLELWHWLFPLSGVSSRFFLSWLLVIRSQLKCHCFREHSPEYTVQNVLSLSCPLWSTCCVSLYRTYTAYDGLYIFVLFMGHHRSFLPLFPECKFCDSRNFGKFTAEPKTGPST